MLIFPNVRTTYLKAYRERINLQLSFLPKCDFLTQVQKESIATIYKETIAILDEVITSRIEVVAPELI